jgi:hypothetical protein
VESISAARSRATESCAQSAAEAGVKAAPTHWADTA